MSRDVLLLSGGLDSVCAWYVLGKPNAIYIGGEYGPARAANEGELRAIVAIRAADRELADKLTLVRFDFRPFMREGVYDFPRDMLVCQLAWAAGFDHMMMAWVKDDGATPEWAERQARNIGKHVGMPNFRVSFPVVHMSKAELINAALEAGAPREVIRATHSCVRAGRPCGECYACKRRASALEAAHVA